MKLYPRETSGILEQGVPALLDLHVGHPAHGAGAADGSDCTARDIQYRRRHTDKSVFQLLTLHSVPIPADLCQVL